MDKNNSNTQRDDKKWDDVNDWYNDNDLLISTDDKSVTMYEEEYVVDNYNTEDIYSDGKKIISKIKKNSKKLLLSILPIVGIIISWFNMKELLAYAPNGTHANLGHMYDGIIMLLDIGVILFFLLSLILTWVSKRFRWYIYIINILMLLFVGLMALNEGKRYLSVKKQQSEDKKDEIANGKIDTIWEIINDKKVAKTEINEISKEHYSKDVMIRIATLNLALYVKSPTEFKEYKNKAIEIYSNECPLFKELIGHVKSIDEQIYVELLRDIKESKEEKTYAVFLSCLPMGKVEFVTKLLDENKTKAVAIILEHEIFRTEYLASIIGELKKIEDKKLRFELITLALESYEYNTAHFYSFKKEMKYVFETLPVYEALKGSSRFTSYIDTLQKQLLKKREESFILGRYVRDSRQLLTNEYFKRDFLKMKDILDDNSSLMQEIPRYIKKHYLDEEIKDKTPDRYGLYLKELTYKDERGNKRTYGNSVYSLYIDNKKVQTSLTGYYGKIHYRFNKKDLGKDVMIKYNSITIIDKLNENKQKRYDSRDKEYWIVDE